MPLLDEWKAFEGKAPPFVLPGDEPLLNNAGRYVVHTSIEEYEQSGDANRTEDSRFHLGLLPQPFHGLLETARVYVLMLNPGHDPRDYAWEFGPSAFRETLRRSYSGTTPMLFLDPTFREHPGYRWWVNGVQLRRIVESVGQYRGLSTVEAQRAVASEVASLELFPYHSRHFDRHELLGDLRSVALARAFVRDHVRPRAMAGDCGVVVARGNWAWGLEESENVVVYSGVEPVSARLGPSSRGGALMLKMLGVP